MVLMISDRLLVNLVCFGLMACLCFWILCIMDPWRKRLGRFLFFLGLYIWLAANIWLSWQ
jgi:hypothetical protein